jgi:ABC-type polysaccharide/polyol phosphate transport system ATPase subunit
VTFQIQVDDVSLAYFLDRGRAGTIKEAIIRRLQGKHEKERLWALSGISAAIKPGEVFAVIGPNGAGKTTLMKLIARVLPPTSGRVVVRGLVAPIISLGAGFNTELSARENIVLYGSLLGRDPSYMRQRVSAILDWAEVSEFGEVPVRNYSSGMVARLAFGVATDVQPDVLVVDEVFAVGDQEFKKKSQAKMEELIGRGTTVVLVSHAMNLVKRAAHRVMWLEHGQVKMVGNPEEVVAAYEGEEG